MVQNNKYYGSIFGIDLIKELKNNYSVFTKISKIYFIRSFYKRVKKLPERGVIKFSVDVDYIKIGYNYLSIMGIDTLLEYFLSN